jgi:Animal haem peroxidase
MATPPPGPTNQAPKPTTPVDPPIHGVEPRGLENLPSSPQFAGRFGRMFRNLPVFSASVEALTDLAARMISAAEPEVPAGQPDPEENPAIPAGYTYLGQFVDHDITFDPASSLQKQSDPDALVDFRTPRFDLDSVYGRGPADQPYLYDKDHSGKLLMGDTVSGEPAFAGPDVPRNTQERALIGDPRNDENIIVSQLQSVFMRFHNAVLDHVVGEGSLVDPNDVFKEAQRLVRWHYQWIVVHDLLANHVIGPEVVADILQADAYKVGGAAPQQGTLTRPHLLFYKSHENPFMPVEFSVAAYRFGHSMIRPSYFFNDRVKQAHENKRIAIFSANTEPGNLENLNGFRKLPREWGFQWRFFFELDPGNPAQRSYKIDDQLSNPLGSLPPTEAPTPDITSLGARNLIRGLRLGLPSGQNVARAMGLDALSDTDLGLTGELAGNAPLWYYVLREAKMSGNSERLGPVGGRIVAEVLIGLLAADPLSYLNVAPNWRPAPPFTATEGADFTMPDLIRFAKADTPPQPQPAPPPQGWTG